MQSKAGVRAAGRRRFGKDTQKTIELTVLALPALLLLIAFHYVAMPGIIMAFKNFNFRDGIFGSPWFGLENFRFVFITSVSLRALANTVLYNLAFIVTGLVGSILLAIMLYEVRNRFALKAYQTLIFIPYFLSWTIVTYLVYAFLANGNGMVNGLLQNLGHEKIKFYNEPEFWPWIHIIMHFWKGFGYSTLLYYAYILNIDPSYYEAAEIDGASRGQKIRYITVPCLSPIILINLLNALGRIFNADFSQFWMLPMESSYLKNVSNVLDTYVYSALLGSAGVGQAAAAGLFQSVAGFLLVIGANKFIRSKFGARSAMY